MIKVDALGMSCPFPVIEAKKALRSAPEDGVEVLVDNETAVQNLTRLGDSMQLAVEVTEEGEQRFCVRLTPSDDVDKAPVAHHDDEYIVQISGPIMGSGDDELGAVLIKSFLYSLTEQDTLPQAIVFYNGGVTLTCEGSPVLDDLKALKERGVTIQSCGLCLNYLGLEEKLAVGEITNMYRIVELLRTYRSVRP